MLAVALIVAAAVLAPLSVIAGYVRGELLDTNSYLEIVGPLARDPAVQHQVVEAVTTTVVDSVRLDDLTENALELLRTRDGRLAQLLNSDRRLAESLNAVLSGLGPLLQNQLDEATRRATERVIESPRFAELWIEANRVAHAATLAALRDEGSALRTTDGAVRIDVGVVVEEVRSRLIASGFSLAELIPASDSEVVIISSVQLARVQRALLLFDQLAPWLPWVTLALAVAAVLVAPGRRRAVLGVAAAVAASMLVLAVVLGLGRNEVLDRGTASGLEPVAAAVIVDAALDPLWFRVWLVFAVTVVLAFGAVLTGPARSRVSGAIEKLRARARNRA